MTTYTTATLAAELMTDRAEANLKSATRTLRKFLRDELGEGKAVVGKGGRYTLDYNKTQLKALAKKFAAWEVAQAEAAEARKAALEAAKAPKVDPAPAPAIDDAEDAADDYEGPSDDEIAAMLEDDEA